MTRRGRWILTLFTVAATAVIAAVVAGAAGPSLEIVTPDQKPSAPTKPAAAKPKDDPRAPMPAVQPSPTEPALARAPKCFGAPARNPFGTSCHVAKAAQDRILPSLEVATRRYPIGCPNVGPDVLEICPFGVPRERARRVVVLVGDSHAAHWRPMFERLAEERGWYVVSITYTACPLSMAVRNLPDPARFVECAKWKKKVFRWFSRQRGIDTVFVAGLSGGTGVIPEPGRSEFATAVRGYMRAWRAILRSAHRIVALRDTPKYSSKIVDCVTSALEYGAPPATACARSRARAIDPDPLMAAARKLDTPRIQTVDLTDMFCDRARCFAVIGSALVSRDETHLTRAFTTTVAPVLARELDRLKVP